LISRGGAGGEPDRKGHDPSPGQWGAGGGGGGAFAGDANYFGGKGGDGYVKVFVVG
jgi:hypothetical protein